MILSNINILMGKWFNFVGEDVEVFTIDFSSISLIQLGSRKREKCLSISI